MTGDFQIICGSMSGQIAGRRPQLKPLINKTLIMWSDNFNLQLSLSHYFFGKKFLIFKNNSTYMDEIENRRNLV